MVFMTSPYDEKTGRKCSVCKVGDIIESFSMRRDPNAGPPIIGPGSRNQIKKFSNGLHCDKCGLMYAFVPPEDIQAVPKEPTSTS